MSGWSPRAEDAVVTGDAPVSAADQPRTDDRTAVVTTVSTRAAAGVYADRSGPVIVDALRAAGFSTGDPVVVADGDPLADALRAAVAAGHPVVITTGGTGLGPDDRTPELTGGLIDREIPQLAAQIARYGVDHGV